MNIAEQDEVAELILGIWLKTIKPEITCFPVLKVLDTQKAGE
jgi:hypothetical protein